MRAFISSIIITAITVGVPCMAVAETVYTAAMIQDEINRARPGDVVTIPIGRYEGSLLLKSGIALAGAEGGETVIDGSGHDTAIIGAQGALLSHLTVIGGKTGVDTAGCFMGTFDCCVKSGNGAAIQVTGGSAVIVNNVIVGGSTSCNSSNPILICNTLVPGETDGISSWYGPGPSAANNLITGARCAVIAGAGAAPELENNGYWANRKDTEGCDPDPKALCADPLFVDPAAGDYRLGPSSPMIGAGIPVADVWENVGPDVGWNAGRSFSIEECRAVMARLAASRVAKSASIVYTLGGPLGEFLVTVRNPNATFSVRSSTADTEIGDIEAFDVKGEESLGAELLGEAYPRVNVRSGGSPSAPSANALDTGPPDPGNRYTLRNVYRNVASYYEVEGGLRIFKRRTNVGRVAVVIPEEFRFEYALLNGVPVAGEISGPFEVREPGVKEIEVGLAPR